MNPKLLDKINKAIAKEAKFGNWSKRLVRGIQHEVKEDLVIPMLSLRANARVKIRYPDDETIELFIGGRDLSFDRKTGECVGTGTFLI